MKKLIFFLLISTLSSVSFAKENSFPKELDYDLISAQDDWRKGVYNGAVPEYLLILDLDYKSMMGDNSQLNPFGYGFTIGYQYKTDKIRNKFAVTHGFGFYTGITNYPGAAIKYNSIGSASDLTKFGNYKSYGYTPLMLSYNIYLSKNKSNVYFGIDAGANMMFRDRDYMEKGLITFYRHYNDVNEFRVSRFVPTFKGYVGYMHELSLNWKLKAQAGVDYMLGYKMDGYSVVIKNGVETPVIGKFETKGLMNLSFSLGLVYSL